MAQVARQRFIGEVIKNSSALTIKVRVARERNHPVVKKTIILHKNFLVHDPQQMAVVGDIVRIDSAPEKISKRKNFILGEIIYPAERILDEETGILYTQRKNIEVPVMKAGQINV
ncbi:hypothetical protein HK096_007065 [Nowakowskiella sp. JEL0078]|nr:hypothetical protein HK096_007065 [Nowakowskiella sp. JEL0078]